MQDTQYIVQLLEKKIAGTLSLAEEAELRAWANSDPAYQALLDRIQNDHSMDELLLIRHELEAQGGSNYIDRLQETLSARIEGERAGTRSRGGRSWIPYVAAVFIGLISGIWFLFNTEENPQTEPMVEQTDDILPGGNRATLTLANGQTVDLSEKQSGIIIGDEVTYADGSKIGDGQPLKIDNHNQLSTAYYQLTTPRGGNYQVTLSDGTEVWLNAASTLRYPPTFSRDERVVEVVGEAYFAVTRDKKRPFRILSKGQRVEVLGTEFNIAAYPDESEMKTTLIEGRVLVEPNNNRQPSVTMSPGEQAIVCEGNLSKKKVDVEAFTAWKSGKFHFDGKSFAHVMKEVSRWYDLQIVYEGTVPTGKLVGDAYRDQNLSIVLGMLDVLDIDYQLDISERKLTIYNKKGGNV